MRKLFLKTHHRSTRSRAQAMVEFALVLPLLLIVIVGIFEFSRLLFAWIILENATRFGIRYATTGAYDAAYCASFPGGVCDDDDEVDAARIPSIKAETTRMVIGFYKIDHLTNPSVMPQTDLYYNVTVCSDERTWRPPVQRTDKYAKCTLPSDDTVTSEHAGSPGNRVYVAADYDFKFMVMPLFGFGPDRIHLASYRLGYVEQFRSARAINTPLPMSLPTLTPSITPTPSDTSTPTQTWTPSMTSTPIPSMTLTFTNTPSRTPSSTISPTPTVSRTPTFTRTPSRTPTRTLSPTITLTPSRTLSPTITLTPSRTPTRPTPTRTLSPTITLTPSRTPTQPTRTPTNTRTPSQTPSRTSTTAPSTNTFTPGPPTNTRTSTPRPPTTVAPPTTGPTNTRTPTRTPTVCLDC